MSDKCYVCGCENGTGDNELRPYGPNGSPICAGCCFGNPERKKEAIKQLNIILDTCEELGVLPVIGDGPMRPMTVNRVPGKAS